MLKLSLERETRGGTVGISLDNPTEERCLPLSGQNTNLQFYDTLRLQRKPASPSRAKRKVKVQSSLICGKETEGIKGRGLLM